NSSPSSKNTISHTTNATSGTDTLAYNVMDICWCQHEMPSSSINFIFLIVSPDHIRHYSHTHTSVFAAILPQMNTARKAASSSNRSTLLHLFCRLYNRRRSIFERSNIPNLPALQKLFLCPKH